jgi:hypothetical protein
MTQIPSTEASQERRYKSPTFSPRGAFATTLRSAEIGRVSRPVQQSRPTILREARHVNGAERRFETPTFSPRGAFATTLRSAEIARRERERRQPATRQLDVLVCAA